MSNLIVVGFKKDLYRASVVLNQLSALNDDWVIDLRDAVAVYRDYNGKLRIDQTYQMTTGESAGWGALWGSLIGLTLAIPFTAGATAVVATGALAAGALSGGALGAASGALDADWWTVPMVSTRISCRKSARWYSPATRRSSRWCAAPTPSTSPISSAATAAPSFAPR